MKKIALILLLVLVVSIGFSQQKKYVSYTVKKGETMKTIAKSYKISTRDLMRLNPDVKKKPKANTVIIVPNLNYGKTVDTVSETTVEKGIYIVKAKETWFGISKQFNITVEELKVANLAVSDLKIGTKLRIPEVKEVKEDVLKYQLHTVVKDDTIYNITKRFNVSEEELLNLNPALKEGLKLGMVLKIKPILEGTLVEIDSLNVIDDSKKVFVEDFTNVRNINAVLMLPYQINKLKDSTIYKSFKKSHLLNIATDFHMGALMAVDSLKAKGVNVHLDYFDTENSTQKIQYLVNNNSFDNADVVIGPLFYEKAVSLSKKINAPVIAPLHSSKQDQIASNNIVKSKPDVKLLDEVLLNYLKEEYKGENIVIINDGTTKSQKHLWNVVNNIKAFDSIQTVSVIKPLPKKDGKKNLVINNEKLLEKLSLTSNNWIILITDENETTASAINGLKSYESEEFSLKLFAVNKGRNFDKIDNNLLGSLEFTYPTTEYLDMSNTLVRRFYSKYQKKYSAVPSKYSIRGFDVTYDVLARLACTESFEKGMKAGLSSRLSATFDFNKRIFGSIENKAIRIIHYNKELMPNIIEQ